MVRRGLDTAVGFRKAHLRRRANVTSSFPGTKEASFLLSPSAKLDYLVTGQERATGSALGDSMKQSAHFVGWFLNFSQSNPFKFFSSIRRGNTDGGTGKGTLSSLRTSPVCVGEQAGPGLFTPINNAGARCAYPPVPQGPLRTQGSFCPNTSERGLFILLRILILTLQRRGNGNLPQGVTFQNSQLWAESRRLFPALSLLEVNVSYGEYVGMESGKTALRMKA